MEGVRSMFAKLRKRGALFALVFAFALVAAACGDDDTADTTTAAPTTTTTEAATTTTAGPTTTQAPTTTLPPPEPGREILACQVSDTGGIDDKSFNETAWNGALAAQDQLEGVTVEFLESQAATDFRPNIDSFINKGCDVIITVGFLLEADTAAAARDNPDQRFAIIDAAPNAFSWADVDGNFDPAWYVNVRPITFATDEAAFLAGYMAAGLSTTGIVGTFGGLNIPTVTIFMDGFLKGVNHHNSVKGTSVAVLGWDGAEGLFTNNFESLDDGRTFAQNLVDEGADIILPVAGPVGLGSAALCQETGACVMIGVDADQTLTAPEYTSVWATSVMKLMDVAVFNTINNVLVLGDVGNAFVGTLANQGVGLAPFHDFESTVPAELSSEMDAIRDAIVAAGSLQAFIDAQAAG
jgi:basic membrane protein A